MQVEVPSFLYTQSWVGLAIMLAYFLVATLAVRFRPRRRVTVTRYEPPQGISAAVAAYLVGSGGGEKAFAAAIISLASKGFVQILQERDLFTLQKVSHPDVPLAPEEKLLMENFFPSDLRQYSCDPATASGLREIYDRFEQMVDGIVEPELISRHLVLWSIGLAYSLVVLVPVAAPLPVFAGEVSLLSLAYCSIWIFLGGSCFIAALHVWPATLIKLWSFIPGDERPSRPLTPSDITPVVLTASALFGFGLLAYVTTTKFALMLAAAILMSTVFRHFLLAPTRAGRRAIAELMDFRDFLARADADRLNRENRPGQSPRVLEEHSAFAVGLGVEHGWGEEFTDQLLELLQMELAYRRLV